MSNMNLILKRNYNNNFIFRTLLSIYRGKKSFFRHWKIVPAPTSQLWPGIFQSSKMSNNQLSRFVSLLLTCWLISRCDTYRVDFSGVWLLYKWCHWTKLPSHHFLSGRKQICTKRTKKSFCNTMKIISVVLQCCWLCCQPPHLAGTHTVLKCLW